MREVYAEHTRRLSDVKRIPAWLTYTVLRIVFFAVPFTVFFVIGYSPWLAAILAAVVALSLSLLLLTRFRNATSRSIFEARANRTPTRSADELAEDSVLDED